ncbi:hypothetical protein FACS189472_15230 [Alphaproteobacteria bacterium]|nr:hypothetical protein FACS189472_15230 [Alphaproteobacteria bacterium]
MSRKTRITRPIKGHNTNTYVHTDPNAYTGTSGTLNVFVCVCMTYMRGACDLTIDVCVGYIVYTRVCVRFRFLYTIFWCSAASWGSSELFFKLWAL